MGFSTFDWVVVGIYLLASVLIGASFFKKHENAKDYLLAGRNMHWFPIAISIIATDLSALSYIGVPALVYKTDLKYMITAIMMPLQMLLVVVVFVPLLYRLNIYTVYGYLERRFNKTTRLYAALLFMGGRGAWLATMIFATSVVLTEITGIDTVTAIIICGLATTAYTFLGGMEAVVWTDFMQFFVLVGGAIAILLFILYGFGWDFGQIWTIASNTGHTKFVDFSFDFTKAFTFWGLLFGSLIYQISTYGTDQLNVQRYFATKDLKSTIWATLGSAVILFPILILLYVIGLGLVAYYHSHPELQATLGNPDRVMPHFTSNVLPMGLRGLVIAGIFAATMSSMSAGINSLSTSTMKDLLEQISPKLIKNELFWARSLCLGWGVLVTIIALVMISGQLTIIERFNSIYQLFAGPLAGIFLLGILSKRTSAVPVLLGSVVGFATAIYVQQTTNIHWLWFAPIGFAVTYFIGYVGSFIISSSNSAEPEATQNAS
ncbi:MAG: sodium:solute symporter family transporter [Pyrinomonadaceae bacterium]